MYFLIVSDREYKKTSRGMDLITTLLSEKGHQIDHLVFFKRKKFQERHVSNNIRQIYFYDPLKLYRSRLQFLFPGFILISYFRYIIRKQTTINFINYDYVILESGHPNYLALEINNKIIYRQSDSVYISFNSNRTFYKKLEEMVINRSIITTSAINGKFFPIQYKDKFIFWHSGFIPFRNTDVIKTTNSIVIIGDKVDWKLINKISKKFTEYNFNMITTSKRRIKNKNVIIKGYLEYNEYLKTISSSRAVIIPYSKRFAYQSRQHSFTAKILVPMSMGLPILLSAYGMVQKSDPEKKLFVYESHKDAICLFEDIINRVIHNEFTREVSKETQDFLRPQMYENRMKELNSFFENILNQKT